MKNDKLSLCNSAELLPAAGCVAAIYAALAWYWLLVEKFSEFSFWLVVGAGAMLGVAFVILSTPAHLLGISANSRGAGLSFVS